LDETIAGRVNTTKPPTINTFDTFDSNVWITSSARYAMPIKVKGTK
jgi:hypothetical protein